MRAVEAEGLRKRYGPGVVALDGMSFGVDSGSLFALLGPNGAGKSTCVRILTTLARPDAGSARVAGVDVVTAPETVRRRIGVVGQKHGSDPLATGRENLELHASLYGLYGAAARRRVDELLERFGIADAAGRVVRTYSGGMQRRLDVAMGLIHTPGVLFLDEPTTGLDPEARRDVWREVRGMAREHGMTILLTTHYLEEADEFAIVDHGRIVVQGTPAALKRSLAGDSVRVQLAQDAPAQHLLGALERVAGLTEVAVDRRAVRARAANGGAATPALLDALRAAGAAVATITVAGPSLDDVYLHHTGREFRTADAAAAKAGEGG